MFLAVNSLNIRSGYKTLKTSSINKNVKMVGWVSLFTDLASKMLYPIMPLYLSSIGFNALNIGFLEGFVEILAGLSKGYFGKLSDVVGKRLKFIQIGYGISAIARPLFVLFKAPLWVFFMRALDRLGKGVRTSSRDALLSDEATKETKGKVFGFHRTMDSLGAALGPIIAFVFLSAEPGNYTSLFWWAAIPGVLAIGFTLFIKEKPKPLVQVNTTSTKQGFFSYFKYWGESSPSYKRLVSGLLLFTLFNSSDFFLLLWLQHIGFSDGEVLFSYILYNGVYSLLSYSFGSLGDRIGLKTVLIISFLLFAVTYIGLPYVQHIYAPFILFIIYGAFSASFEGIAKAYITNVALPEQVGTAIGFYNSSHSVMAFCSSSIAGIIWYKISPETLLYFAGIGAIVSAVYFLLFVKAE